MTHLTRLLAASALAAGLGACATAPQPALPIDAASLHARILTLDTHVDIPLDYMVEVDPSTDTDLQVDFAKMEAGGLDAAFFIVYTPQTAVSPEGYAEAARIADTRLEAIERMVATYPDRIALARSAEDVRSIVASGRLAALIGMENAYPMGDSVAMVPELAERGVRYVGLTHFGANQFGDSSGTKDYETDAALTTHGGLSPLGRELVSALNDHGILVDVSHAGDETTRQAVALSRAPVIASHSGVDGEFDHIRNLPDDLLDAIAAKGGVVQLVALGAYVRPWTDEQQAALDALPDDMEEDARDTAVAAIRALGPVTVADYADHIDYAVARMGIDHVGIASDFDGGGGIEGWQDASTTQVVTEELLARGYSEEDIAKIWGGNVLRIMEAAEAAAIR